MIKMKLGTRNDKGTGMGEGLFGDGIWEVSDRDFDHDVVFNLFASTSFRRLRKFGTIGHFSDNPTTIPLFNKFVECMFYLAHGRWGGTRTQTQSRHYNTINIDHFLLTRQT